MDNNSRDRTAELIKGTRATYVLETKQGYGNALQRGLAEASRSGAELIVMAEPDGTFAGKDVMKLLAFADDFDLVLGTRTTPELIWQEANMGRFLRWGNWAVAKFLQVLHDGPSLSDCGCTLRLVHANAYRVFAETLRSGRRTSCRKWSAWHWLRECASSKSRSTIADGSVKAKSPDP